MLQPFSLWIPYQIVFAVGVVTLVRILLMSIRAFWATFIRPSKNLLRYGEWCVITGATDGIGKAFAFEMARKGLHIILISRTKSKLNKTMSAIQKEYPKIKVRTLAIDFSLFDNESREKVSCMISDLDVGILINNVGISYSYPMFFNELQDINVQKLIDVNISSTCWMTRIVLPGMISRKRGAIVNMSSASSRNPSPLLIGYSGSKAYIDLFSQSLDAELRSKGIHVQAQCPLFVATKMSKIRNPRVDAPSAKTYVRAATSAIGYESLCSPYWCHKLMLWGMSLLPRSFLETQIKKLHLSIRKRALKKLQKSQ